MIYKKTDYFQRKFNLFSFMIWIYQSFRTYVLYYWSISSVPSIYLYLKTRIQWFLNKVIKMALVYNYHAIFLYIRIFYCHVNLIPSFVIIMAPSFKSRPTALLKAPLLMFSSDLISSGELLSFISSIPPPDFNLSIIF